MRDLATARQLILDMTADATEIEEVQETEDGIWGFGFADESVMTCEWADEPPRFVLTFFLGEPPEEGRLAACELLLAFNQMSVESGGVRGALADEGQFTLVYDLHGTQLSGVELRDTVMQFAELGRQWHRTLQGDVDMSQAAPSPGS